MPLTFIVLACNMNVAVPVEDEKNCKFFTQELPQEHVEQNWTPMSCMMSSMFMVVQFHQDHPGWQVKKWSCRNIPREQEI